MNVRTALASAAVVLVAVGLGLGFAEFGSPEHNRLLRDDAARVDAIRSLAIRISIGLCGRCGKGHVPARVAERDLAYTRETFGRYRICASFALPTSEDADDYAYEPAWHHPAGSYCYRFSADSSTPI